ncbi:MAG: LCP family protein [Candidatus Limnocylindria bacterium]
MTWIRALLPRRGARVVAALALAFSPLAACTQQSGDSGAPATTTAATATSVPTPTEPPLDESLLDRRVTVLILGKDWNATREANGEPHNTDAIMVVSVSGEYDRITMLSIPRDTVDVPMPDGTTWSDKINAITRELGYEEMVGAVETLLDIEIDHYAEVDMDDFVTLVDAVDGVDVEPEEGIDDPAHGFVLEAGEHHLDGSDALSYVRARQDGDHARSARQQEVVLGIVESLLDADSEVDVIELAEGLTSLETDIPITSLPTFLEIARRSHNADVSRQVLQPPRFALFEGDEGTARGWVMIPNVDEMRAYAAEVIGD